MSARRSDAARLDDIRRSADHLQEILRGGYEAFAHSWRSQSATIRELDLIGEAASGISTLLRDRYPEVRWQAMRGYREFAAQDSRRVNLELVWKAVSAMSGLKEQLSRVITKGE
jgi:uncharacterized protein with HEPN domain